MFIVVVISYCMLYVRGKHWTSTELTIANIILNSNSDGLDIF